MFFLDFGGVPAAGFFCLDVALVALGFDTAAVDYARDLSGKWFKITTENYDL